MCTLSRLVRPAASLFFMLESMILAASSPSAAQNVCPGFDRKHTITRLGGPNALAPGGGHSRTRAELQTYFAANTESLHALLASQGLGKEVADALFEAVRQGTGITERSMPEGDRLQWMAYRKNGRVVAIENVCLNLPGAAPAFEITVRVVTAAQTARADCSLDVTTDHQPGGTSTFRVRTAPGARVTMEGPAGTRTIIEGGGSTWTGPWEDPYRADYAFTATSERATTETIAAYTFLVPRECLNLALVGRTEEQRAGKPESCTERRAVPRPVPLVPPVPPVQSVQSPPSVEVGRADWIVRPFAAYLIANGETSGTVFPGSCPCPAGTTYGYDDGFGLGLSVERLLGERFGVEARVLYGRLDDRFWIGANGLGITESEKLDYWDLSLGLNVHLTPQGAVDWYAGPFVGYGIVDGHRSLVVDRSLEYDARGGLTWGVQTGLDWPFGHGPWSLHVGGRYTWYAADPTYRYTDPGGAVFEQRKSLDLDPITLELGVAYHF
ncbi:MAG: porin family protein [Holophagales bacterium]|jgi:outer membrane protein W|nr:porin family protein [Holophagales bacterium]